MTLLTMCFGMGAWVRTGLFCGHQDLSPKYASIMLGITNTAAAIASTLSTFFTGYFFNATGGNWALSLFLPIAFFQAISVVLFQALRIDPGGFRRGLNFTSRLERLESCRRGVEGSSSAPCAYLSISTRVLHGRNILDILRRA